MLVRARSIATAASLLWFICPVAPVPTLLIDGVSGWQMQMRTQGANWAKQRAEWPGAQWSQSLPRSAGPQAPASVPACSSSAACAAAGCTETCAHPSSNPIRLQKTTCRFGRSLHSLALFTKSRASRPDTTGICREHFMPAAHFAKPNKGRLQTGHLPSPEQAFKPGQASIEAKPKESLTT